MSALSVPTAPPPPAGSPVAPPVLELRGITKTYGSGDAVVHALRRVHLQVERGDYVAIRGRSGSGKSTLMNILGCLDGPSTGRYLLDGRDVSGLDESDLADVRNRRIGFVFQSFNLLPRLDARANVELPLVYAGLRARDRRARAERALAFLGLGDRSGHRPAELSGGQQQRVAIARAIVTNPAIILADEPTGNLDSQVTEGVLSVFDRLNAAGRTIVLITHEDDVSAHAKRVIELHDGLVVADERNQDVAGLPPALDPAHGWGVDR